MGEGRAENLNEHSQENMRLISNKKSVAKGEVSVLAIVETLLASGLVFYLSAHFNAVRWLAVAVCVASVLLMRTEESKLLETEWWDYLEEKQEQLEDKPVSFILNRFPEKIGIAVLNMIVVVLNTLQAFAFKAGATLLTVLRSPAISLQAIPRNWSHLTLVVDSLYPPEIVPKTRREKFEVSTESFSSDDYRHRLVSLFAFPEFLPSLFYRWSLKATSIIYAPLVFVAHSTFNEGADLRTKLELIKRGDLSRIRALYGGVAIAVFLVKLVLMMKWNGFAEWWNGNPITEFLALYIVPSEIPRWQIAEVANSVLAVGAMIFARYALLRYELNNPWAEKPVKRLLGFVSGMRWVLALYAIVCLGYITMRAAHDWHWPALGTKWLPFL
jgi:hypothetical protein